LKGYFAHQLQPTVGFLDRIFASKALIFLVFFSVVLEGILFPVIASLKVSHSSLIGLEIIALFYSRGSRTFLRA